MTKTHIIAPWTVYACDDCYPHGGSSDAIAVFATGGEALAYAQTWAGINPWKNTHSTDTHGYENIYGIPTQNIHICHPAGPLAPVTLPVITLRGSFQQSPGMIEFRRRNGTLPTIYLSQQNGQDNTPMQSVFTHDLPGLPLRATYTLTHTQTIDDGVPTFHRGDTIICSIYHMCPKTGNIINYDPISTIKLYTGRQDILRQALLDAIQQYPDITEHTRVSFLASIPTMDIEDVFTFLPATYTLD